MNKYYGPRIKENQYACNWMKIFEKRKNENADLLLHIVLTDSTDEEDKVIGCQILALTIMERKLWVSDQFVGDLIEDISCNLSRVQEWFENDNNETSSYPDTWINVRRKDIFDLMQKFMSYARIVHKPNPSIEINNLIEKMVACGSDTEEALTEILTTLVNIAKSKYKLSPEIALPEAVVKRVEDARLAIHNYIGDDVALQARFVNITGALWEVSHKRKWKLQ